MAWIYIAYFLSGFVSLVYQIVWYRYFVDSLGASNITFVLVLCCFLGGIGVGSGVSRWVTAVLRPRLGGKNFLSFYGQIELIIASTALGVFLFSLLPNYLAGSFPYALKGSVYEPTLGYQTCKGLAVVLSVFVPCFFMGLTFPLLCATFRKREEFPARLYAWNAMGACGAVLMCEFVLIRYFGTTAAFCTAIAVNALLGAAFVKYGQSIFDRLVLGQPASSERGKNTGKELKKSSRVRSDTAAPMPMETAITCAIVSGLLAGGLEADIMKRFGLWGEHLKISFSFIVFWAILAIFLSSSCIRRYRPRRFSVIVALFVVALVYHLAASALHFGVWRKVNDFIVAHVTRDFYAEGLLQTLIMTGFVIFPTYFCISLLLPHVCNRCQQHERHLGVVYGLNTTAFCCGVLFFGWIAPLASPFYAMRIFIGIFAACVAYLLTLKETAPPRRYPLVALGAVIGIILLSSSREFDKDFFRGRPPAYCPVSDVRSDGAHLVYIVARKDYRVMYFDAYPMAGVNARSLQYMKLMAHFPLLAQPKPKSALLIGFGVGNTAGAILDHSTIERLDVVDLSDPVFELASRFADTNNKAYEDKRVRLIHDDGRNFLDLAKNTYDLITAEPPPPTMPGVGRLYSREYYLACRKNLSPNGIISQWLPLYQVTSEMADRMVSTFREVFPETMFFVGWGPDIIMLGSCKPIDLACIERQFSQERPVVEDLKSLGVTSPVNLLARIYLVDKTIDECFQDKPILTDEKNFLEYAVTTDFKRLDTTKGRDVYASIYTERSPVLPYSPLPVLEEFKKEHLQSYDELAKVLSNPEALERVVPDFPFRTSVRPIRLIDLGR